MAIKPNKITGLQQAIQKLGISISVDQIRKLEKAGIVFNTRSEGKHRLFTDEQFKKSMKNILLYYFNTPIAEIKSGDAALLQARAKNILRVARSLTK